MRTELLDTLSRLKTQEAEIASKIKEIEAALHHLAKRDAVWDSIYAEIESYQVIANPKPTKHPKRRAYNSTEKWLYDGRAANYESFREFCLRHGSRDIKTSFAVQSMEDYFGDFVVFICQKDHLAPMLDNGRQVNYNSVFYHFKQFIHRACMEEGQDAHMRTMHHRKTQQENKNGKRYAYQSADVATALIQKDEETGEIKDTDYCLDLSDNEAEREAISENISSHIRDLLTQKYGEETGTFRYQIYRENVDKTYETYTEWASAKGITTVHLRKHLEAIGKTITTHKDDFGF